VLNQGPPEPRSPTLLPSSNRESSPTSEQRRPPPTILRRSREPLGKKAQGEPRAAGTILFLPNQPGDPDPFVTRPCRLRRGVSRRWAILVTYRLTLDTFCTKKVPSAQWRNDNGRGEVFGCGGSSPSGLGQIVAVRPGDTLDHFDVQQAAQLPRQPAWREHVQVGEKSARRIPAMLTRGFCRVCSSALSPGSSRTSLRLIEDYPSDQSGVVGFGGRCQAPEAIA
jgi:hypothetical protein